MLLSRVDTGHCVAGDPPQNVGQRPLNLDADAAPRLEGGKSMDQALKEDCPFQDRPLDDTVSDALEINSAPGTQEGNAPSSIDLATHMDNGASNYGHGTQEGGSLTNYETADNLEGTYSPSSLNPIKSRNMAVNAFKDINSFNRQSGRKSFDGISHADDIPTPDLDSEPLLVRPYSRDTLFRRHGFCNSIHNWFRSVFWTIRYSIFPYSVSNKDRTVFFNSNRHYKHFPPNYVRNQKYSILTLIPHVLYDQFKYFFNLFYLLVALAQFIPALKVGPLFTYVAPLSFVLLISVTKEAYDDYKRYLRDKEANSATYEILDAETCLAKSVRSQDLKVGNILRLHANQRVPCDAVLLRTPAPGTTFIRTDQLDGETDWKLRRPIFTTQSLDNEFELMKIEAWVCAEAPRREIYDFIGTFYVAVQAVQPSQIGQLSGNNLNGAHGTVAQGSSSALASCSLTSVERRFPIPLPSPEPIAIPTTGRGLRKSSEHTTLDVATSDIELGRSIRDLELGSLGRLSSEPLSLENTLWASTVVTSGPVWALVIYTGRETRTALNTSSKTTKFGLFDGEVNAVSKILFGIMVLISAVLVLLKGLRGIWAVYFCRFLLLLSSIIPISLRVNLDLAKTYYSWLIANDSKLKSTVVRNSSLPEELGRIDLVLSDKTGTLTCNEMIFKKLHIGRVCYGDFNLLEIRDQLNISLRLSGQSSLTDPASISKRRKEVMMQLRLTMLAIAVCHNVTPTRDEATSQISFQAASPDEIALTSFASCVGLHLEVATDRLIVLARPDETRLNFQVLHQFPFSSETKRMGCIVRHVPGPGQAEAPMSLEAGRILFFLKGAESVLVPCLDQRGAHWLPEECKNFARTGLRTLVFAMRELTPEEYEIFHERFLAAQTSIRHRAAKVREAIDSLENNLTLLGLTGVEDRLQKDVPETLEALKHGGVRVWVLTGDKIETAICVARLAGLKTRQQKLITLSAEEYPTPQLAQEAMENFSGGLKHSVIVVDGPFIEMALKQFPELFIQTTTEFSTAICCRCSPTQKARIVEAIQRLTGKRTAAIGDGGNDVSMIQAAHCGIGIVGKEGKQASLAADYSITEFRSIHRLLFWHGRNSYERSAKLAQFVIHRGLTIAVIQVIFSSVFFFIPMALFQGWLTVGYATYYTMFPVFSLVFDQELPESVVFMYPELYASLRRGRALSSKTLFAWLWTSVYQGSVIMLGAILLFEADFINIISISFTSLILAELLNVALEITKWHRLMILAEVITLLIYLASIALLPNYFNLSFILSQSFWLKVACITLASWLPLFFLKMFIKVWYPTRVSKLIF